MGANNNFISENLYMTWTIMQIFNKKSCRQVLNEHLQSTMKSHLVPVYEYAGRLLVVMFPALKHFALVTS